MVSLGRPRVLRVAPPLRFESGTPWAAHRRADRVVLLAHWSDRPTVSRSVVELVTQFRRLGYDVVIVSAAEVPGALQWPSGDWPDGVSVFRRKNIGYDFGSWAQALAEIPGLTQSRLVVMANDSLVGPFGPLDEIVSGMEADPHPVWGLVSTTQDRPHLQSHFIAYREGVLGTPRLRAFWQDVRVERTKRDLVVRYEIGLSVALRRQRLGMGIGFPGENVVHHGGNPTSQGWRRLLLWGFPFVKRELVLRPPPEVPDVQDVSAVVRELFDQNVREWV